MVIEKTHLGVGTHSAGGSILTVSWCPTDSCLENDTILENDGKGSRDYSGDVAVELQVFVRLAKSSMHGRKNYASTDRMRRRIC